MVTGARAAPTHLTHYFRRGTEPFLSVTALPEGAALERMRALHVPGSVLWERFGEPRSYLQARLHTERWLRDALVAKGGSPADAQPVYFVLGASRWLERVGDRATRAMTDSVRVPLSLFEEGELGFTYPDSMLSLLLAARRDPATFQPRYHGKLFTRAEMLALVAENGLPEEGWEGHLPDSMPHYVEAQVWNRARLLDWDRHSRAAVTA